MATSVHAQAFNIARRATIKNENDLLQEQFFEDNDTSYKLTEKYCTSIMDKMGSHQLPMECKAFESVRSFIQARDKQDHSIAFAGMHAGEAVNARVARDNGSLSRAQLMRRMTTRNRGW